LAYHDLFIASAHSLPARTGDGQPCLWRPAAGPAFCWCQLLEARGLLGSHRKRCESSRSICVCCLQLRFSHSDQLVQSQRLDWTGCLSILKSQEVNMGADMLLNCAPACKLSPERIQQ